MAGIKISDLPQLSEAPSETDFLVIVDTSTGETKKISAKNFVDVASAFDSAEALSLLSTGVNNILPAADSAYDLGSPSRKWKDLYLSGSTLYLGSETLTSKKVGSLNQITSVKEFGAVGNGVTNDTTAIQNAVNSGAETLHFPAGVYNVDSDIKITSAIKIYGEGTINETALREKTFHITADNVLIDGLSFTGPETYATWMADSVGGRSFQFKSFLWFDGCNNGIVKNVRASGKRGTISVAYGQDFLIDNVSHDGFFVSIDSDDNIPESNFYSHVRLIGGGFHKVNNLHANNVGSVLLIGSSSSNIVAQSISGEEIHDNGIYNSSGLNNSFMGGSFNNVDGSGVKARGSGNVISGFTVENANVGISITGQYDSTGLDGLGANGYGSIIQGNTVRRHKQVGILVDQAYDQTMRDIIVNGNTVDSSAAPRAGSNASIRVRAIRGAQITNNIIRGYETAYGLFVWGDSANGQPQTDAIISGNIFSDGEDGIRTQYLKRSLITGNQGTNLTSQFLEGISMDDCYITNNFAPNDAIYFNPSFLCTGNIVSNNVVSAVVANDTLNTISSATLSNQSGAWVPSYAPASGSFDSVGYALQEGYYVRTGKTVNIFARIATNSVSLGTASGALYITGLPYTSADFTSSYSILKAARVFNFDSDYPTHGWVRRNSDFIDLETKRDVNKQTIVTGVAALSTTPGLANEMIISGTYLIEND